MFVFPQSLQSNLISCQFCRSVSIIWSAEVNSGFEYLSRMITGASIPSMIEVELELHAPSQMPDRTTEDTFCL